MKNYRITVNGVEYEVSVEELGEGAAVSTAPAAAPAAVKAPAAKKPEAKKTGGAEGAVKVNAPMPGKIHASASGVVATVNVSAGDMVEGGDVLATIN